MSRYRGTSFVIVISDSVTLLDSIFDTVRFDSLLLQCSRVLFITEWNKFVYSTFVYVYYNVPD